MRCRTATGGSRPNTSRSEEHTSELQSRGHLVCRLLLEKKKKSIHSTTGICNRAKHPRLATLNARHHLGCGRNFSATHVHRTCDSDPQIASENLHSHSSI